MRFAITDEQRRLAASVHDLLSDADVPAVARSWAEGDPVPGRDLVARLAKVGVCGLAVPERFGGLGAGAVELVVIFEVLGHHAVPGPLVESFAVVPTMIGDLPGANDVLGGLADGGLATAALPPHVPHALDADIATEVYVQLDQSVYKGLVGRRRDSVDPTRRLFDVERAEPLGEAGNALDLGVLCSAAQLLGLGHSLLDQACVHARSRRQFGRPVGEFQAVQHHLANVLVALEFARPLVLAAAMTRAPRDISAAKVAASDAAYRSARAALQVHGAIGYTLEYDLGRLLTKVRALREAWGTRSWHRARVLDDLTGRGSR
jgi:alkylation response protein AidB-like acyl-CoA dehydrogenase